jgi:hypothetical protein
MLRRLVLAAVVAGPTIILGCTTEDGGAALQTAAPGMGFHFLDDGGSAKLAYGQASSDNVGLMMQCAKGSRTVQVSDVVRSASAPTMTLASAGRSSSLKVDVQPGPGAAVATGQAPVSAPALAAFRKSGQIEVSFAGARYGMAARPQERPIIERFFAACERAA